MLPEYSAIFFYVIITQRHYVEMLFSPDGKVTHHWDPALHAMRLGRTSDTDRWVVGKRPVRPARRGTRGLGHPWTLALTLTMPRTHGRALPLNPWIVHR
jgi:hypothetical protein